MQCAYVTLLTRDSYVKGTLCLQRSLAAVSARHPLIVMYTDTLSAHAVEMLAEEGCILRAITKYIPEGDTNSVPYKQPCYAECWSKLRLFEFEDYSRLCFLDADMVVLKNIDHLFLLPQGFWAVPDCSNGRPTEAERNACPLLSSAPSYFNAGLFVISPSRELLRKIERALRKGRLRVGAYAEQDMLNSYFKVNSPEKLRHRGGSINSVLTLCDYNRQGAWNRLPVGFNLQKNVKYHHPHLWAPHDAFVLHFTDHKPWDDNHGHPENAAFADIVALWWRIYQKPAKAESAGADERPEL